LLFCHSIIKRPGRSSLRRRFFVGELTIYLLFKLIRGDFFYWIRLDGKLLPVAVAALNRITVKIIVDFSGCLHFRHPVSYNDGTEERSDDGSDERANRRAWNRGVRKYRSATSDRWQLAALENNNP